MEDQPTFVLDEKIRKEREEEGRILKREDQLQDISNMDLSKYDQKKTEQLMDKSRELRGKAMEQISDVKSKISETASNLKEGSVQKENKSETQVHHGDKPLTEKTKHDILELTEKLTEKIQALKQSNPSETKASSQTQSFEQKYSPPLQERFESQSSTERKEIKPEQYKGELSQSKEQNQPEIKEQQQAQKQEGKSREHQPLVDQVLGRLHSASDSIHHRVEGFKNAFKVEEPKDTERVPLIDQLTHSIHNVTDKITGVFKHKGSTPSKQKGSEEKTLGSYGIGEEFTENFEGFSKTMERALRELGGESFGGKEYSLTRFEEEREETLGSYCIGEEFRENFEGFSKIMERALRELGGESFEGKEYSLTRFEEELEADIEPLDFKLQESREFKGQSGTSGDIGHEFKDFKTQGFEDLSNEGKSSSPELQATESMGTESSHKGRNILKQLEEDIKIIDQMLEKSIAKRTKNEIKESETSFKKSQGFGAISNQSAEIGINPKGASNLTRQVYQDVNANDNLLERAILGERSGQREIFESSAANLYSEGLKSKTEMFRDITNVTGQTSISQQAEKDLSNNDKLLDKSIKEGKAGYRYEPEDKENIGKQMQSKGGANISHCEGLRNITETI